MRIARSLQVRRRLDLGFFGVVVVEALTLVPAWIWVLGGESNSLTIGASVLATLTAAMTIHLWLSNRYLLTGLGLVAVAILAPTGFAYLGNLMCILGALLVFVFVGIGKMSKGSGKSANQSSDA